MEKNITRESSVPLPPEALDVTAVTYLQNKRKRLRLNFNVEAVEYALDKVLQFTNRKATGEQLGKDLYRDGKRKATRLNNFTQLDDELSIEDTSAGFEDTSFSTTSFHSSVCNELSCFFGALSYQERAVLSIALAGQKSNEAYIQEILGVGSRQFRNILYKIQNRIRNNSSISFVFDIAINYWGFNKTDFQKLIGGINE
jgi:hypothetical protein